MRQPADRRKKIVLRILRINTRLECMTAALQPLLRERERLAGSDAQLPLDQIQPGDHFGDGMFDLQASIHFDEIELPACIHELDRAGADVIDRARGSDGRFAHASAHSSGSAGAGASSMTF